MSIRSARSESMHFEITVDVPLAIIAANGQIDVDQTVCFTNSVDVALLFTLPCGVYVDVYELENWVPMQELDAILHVSKDEVPSEGICLNPDGAGTLLALEILNVQETLLPADHNCSSMTMERNLTFSIPLHKQYFAPTFPLLSNLRIDQYIAFPAVMSRLSTEPKDRYYLRNDQRVKKIFQESFLGNAGNSMFSVKERFLMSNYTTISALNSEVSGIRIHSPVGNRHFGQWVNVVTIVVYLCAFMLLFGKILAMK